MDEKVVYSGVQPPGSLTLGNYIGALRNLPPLQEDYDRICCMADIYVITVSREPKVLRAHSLGTLALYLAVGIDPDKSTIYIQPHVPAHVELIWLLNTMTDLGQLQRMTWLRSKAEKTDEVNTGLLNYPVFMASDIPLYGIHYVPVGDDRKQHIEITKDPAEYSSSRYSETFVLSEMLRAKVGGRVMSFQDPTKKMFKSDANEDSFILILDRDGVIRRKFKRAVMDSEGHIAYSDQQAGVKDLLDIYPVYSGRTVEDPLKDYDGKGCGILKGDVARAVIGEIGPIRDCFHEIHDDRAYLEEVYRQRAEKASRLTSKTLRKVYRRMGFTPH